MGVKLTRKKKRHLVLSLMYKLNQWIPLGAEKKFKLFLDLEWVFDRLAHETSYRVYPFDQHSARQHSMAFILEQLSEEHGVLDLGCKYGEISNFLADKVKFVVGIDLDEQAIAQAKQKYERDNLKFEVGEAYDYLSQQSQKFDVLILSHILEHLDESQAFVQKFKHFFQYIYIEVPDFDKYFLNHYRQDKGLQLVYTDDDHVSEFDREEIRFLIQACHLEILKEEYRFGVQKIWCRVL